MCVCLCASSWLNATNLKGLAGVSGDVTVSATTLRPLRHIVHPSNTALLLPAGGERARLLGDRERGGWGTEGRDTEGDLQAPGAGGA